MYQTASNLPFFSLALNDSLSLRTQCIILSVSFKLKWLGLLQFKGTQKRELIDFGNALSLIIILRMSKAYSQLYACLLSSKVIGIYSQLSVPKIAASASDFC